PVDSVSNRPRERLSATADSGGDLRSGRSEPGWVYGEFAGRIAWSPGVARAHGNRDLAFRASHTGEDYEHKENTRVDQRSRSDSPGWRRRSPSDEDEVA